MSEAATFSTSIEHLKSELQKSQELVVVDIGSGNYVSTEEGLVVMVDPEINESKLDYGDNNLSEGQVIAVRAEAGDLIEVLRDKADRVQIIAPRPKDASKMVRDSAEMVKGDGEMVIAFEKLSEQKDEVKNAVSEIKREVAGQFYFKIEEMDEDELGEVVEGELNTNYPGNYIVITLTRER